MLMKLTPGVNFIIILSAASTCTDPKGPKRYWQQLNWSFALLCVIAAHKTLVNLTPGVNFIKVKGENFMYKRLFSSYILALNELLYEKRAQKMLMKLTPWVSWKCAYFFLRPNFLWRELKRENDNFFQKITTSSLFVQILSKKEHPKRRSKKM